jgi:hypothetical protein
MTTDQNYVDCRRCGKFILDPGVVVYVKSAVDVRHLSAFIRRNQGEKPVHITNENAVRVAVGESSVAVPLKLEKLLRLIGERTKVPGEAVQLDPEIDAPYSTL